MSGKIEEKNNLTLTEWSKEESAKIKHAIRHAEQHPDPRIKNKWAGKKYVIIKEGLGYDPTCYSDHDERSSWWYDTSCDYFRFAPDVIIMWPKTPK